MDTCRKFGDILTLQRFVAWMRSSPASFVLCHLRAICTRCDMIRADAFAPVAICCPTKVRAIEKLKPTLVSGCILTRKLIVVDLNQATLNWTLASIAAMFFPTSSWPGAAIYWTPFCAEAKVSASRFWRGRWPTSTCRAWSRYGLRGLLPYCGKRVRRWHYLQHTEHIEQTFNEYCRVVAPERWSW